MRLRFGWVSLGLVLLLAIAGCGSAPSSHSSGRLVPDIFYSGLGHDEVVHAQAIWKREVKRQRVQHLDAVVSVHAARRGLGSKLAACPPGPVLEVVIRGTFPAEPSATGYEDLYASSSGHVCNVLYSKTPPKLPAPLGNHLHRIVDVPNSG